MTYKNNKNLANHRIVKACLLLLILMLPLSAKIYLSGSIFSSAFFDPFFFS